MYYKFDFALASKCSYSETCTIDEHGDLGFKDEEPFPIMVEAYKPADLYQLAKAVADKYSEFQFSFEKDPEGKWIKYTVSRVRSTK